MATVRVSQNAANAQVTKGQLRLVQAFVNRLSSGNTRLDNIMELRNQRGVYRWKPSAEVRSTSEEMEIRVFFCYEGDDIIILDVSERNENTYAAWDRRRNDVTR